MEVHTILEVDRLNKESSVRKKGFEIRIIIQALFLALILLTAMNRFFIENRMDISIPFVSNASLHSLCPFGGVVSIYTLVTRGTFVQKIHESSFVMLAIVLFLSVLFGPVFCGWICPFGSVQEWIGKLGRKMFGRKYNTFVPAKLDKGLRYLRYLVLAWVVYVTAVSSRLMFAQIDPYYALFNFWTGEVAIQAIMILIAVLTTSLFIERPWCKYFCPLGAVLGLFNFLSIFRLKRSDSTCVLCKSCDRVCPMNIAVCKKETIKDHQCIRCLKCTSECGCPVEDALHLGIGNVHGGER